MDEWTAWLGASHLGPGQIALRLGAAIAFSCLIGLDRELKNKPLGLRTNMLVGLGSASFCVIVVELMNSFDPGPHASPIDAGRIIEGIIGGIGFLGAGAIIQERDRIVGATTGAGIWAVGGIGVACGFGPCLRSARPPLARAPRSAASPQSQARRPAHSLMKRSASLRRRTLEFDAEREVGQEGVVDHGLDDHLAESVSTALLLQRLSDRPDLGCYLVLFERVRTLDVGKPNSLAPASIEQLACGGNTVPVAGLGV